jgi:hypothetical protein
MAGSQAAMTQTGVAAGRPVPLASRITATEREAHRQFVATLGQGAIWRGYLDDVPQGARDGAREKN